jgi:hypothetical protein
MSERDTGGPATCKTCQWADVWPREGLRVSYGYALKDGRARCRRYPPICDSTYSVDRYPVVSLLDWCGEHQPRKEQP